MFGGVDKDSDMDLLLTSYESLLSRTEFFTKFSEFLTSEEVGATNVQKVPQAKIPIIKFEYETVHFDMLYCAMRTPRADSFMLEGDYEA